MIDVLSDCDPGIELGWVLGTEFATGWSPPPESRRRSTDRATVTCRSSGENRLSEVCIQFRTAEIGERANSGFLSVLPSGSENVQVMADHHLSTIELTDLLQQHLLRIWSAHSAGVRTVIENQQTGARFLRDLRHLT